MTRFLLHTALLFSGLGVFSQENNEQHSSSMEVASVNASGGNAASTVGSVAYSIGIINYTYIESLDNKVSQGVQQSEQFDAEIDTEGDVANVLAYPNPVTNYIILDIADFKNEPTQYQIFSSNGSVLKTGLITEKTTKLATDHLSNAIYFLRITVLNEFEETLKIIKR